MGWVFLQVFLAFGTGVLIVWWTWPKAAKPPKLPATHDATGSQKKADAAASGSTDDPTN